MKLYSLILLAGINLAAAHVTPARVMSNHVARTADDAAAGAILTNKVNATLGYIDHDSCDEEARYGIDWSLQACSRAVGRAALVAASRDLEDRHSLAEYKDGLKDSFGWHLNETERAVVADNLKDLANWCTNMTKVTVPGGSNSSSKIYCARGEDCGKKEVMQATVGSGLGLGICPAPLESIWGWCGGFSSPTKIFIEKSSEEVFSSNWQEGRALAGLDRARSRSAHVRFIRMTYVLFCQWEWSWRSRQDFEGEGTMPSPSLLDEKLVQKLERLWQEEHGFETN